MMSDKARQQKSKFYEEAFQAILQYVGLIDILQHSGVERSKHYQGQLSGAMRQIDATIHLQNGQRILVECKQREKPYLKLDLGDVEAVVRPINPPKGGDMRQKDKKAKICVKFCSD